MKLASLSHFVIKGGWFGVASARFRIFSCYVLKRKQNRTKTVCSWINTTHSTPTYSLIKNITLCKRGAFRKDLQISTVFNSTHCRCCNGYVSQEGGKEFIPLTFLVGLLGDIDAIHSLKDLA